MNAMTQDILDIAAGIDWLADQILETCEDVAAGSYAPGVFFLGVDPRELAITIDGAGRIIAWEQI